MALDRARQAFARDAWPDAYELFSGLDRATLESADPESLADAAWWTGRLDESIGIRQRAFAPSNVEAVLGQSHKNPWHSAGASPGVEILAPAPR